MSRIGPQSMTMDHVAKMCGMSKRTLYEMFPDKRTLISEAVAFMHKCHLQEFAAIFDAATTHFEALMNVYKHARKHIESTSIVFLDDIKRLYPDIFEQYRDNEKEGVHQFAQVIARAQEEGLVLKRINCEVAATIFFVTMHNLKQSDDLSRSQFNRVEYFDGAFINFLRGIATIKGIEYIDEFIDHNLNLSK